MKRGLKFFGFLKSETETGFILTVTLGHLGRAEDEDWAPFSADRSPQQAIRLRYLLKY